MDRISAQNSVKRFLNGRSFFFFFIILFSVLMIWFLAFYPGNLSYDSLSQWGQASTFVFNNQHPVIYAFLMFALMKLWNTPAAISLLQVFSTAFVVSLYFSFFYKKITNKLIVIVPFVLLLGSIPIGLYTVTLWKDIFYTLGILLIGYLLLKNYYGEIEDKNGFIISLSVIISLTASLRYNGLIYIVVVPALLLIQKKPSWKKIGIYSIVFYLLISVVFSGLLHVENRSALLAEIPKAKLIARSYKDSSYHFTETEKSLLYKIAPEEIWRTQYVCYNDYGLFWSDKFNRNLILDKKVNKEWNSIFLRVLKADPTAAIQERYCISKTLSLGENSIFMIGIEGNSFGLKQTGGKLNALLTKVSFLSIKSPYKTIFWSPWFYLMITLAALLVALKRRNFPVIGFSILTIFNFLTIVLVATSAEVRYVYPSIIGAFIVIPMLFLKIENKELKNEE